MIHLVVKIEKIKHGNKRESSANKFKHRQTRLQARERGIIIHPIKDIVTVKNEMVEDQDVQAPIGPAGPSWK